MRLETLDAESVFVIHDLLSPAECDQLIARSEALGYEAAAVGGEMLPSLRNNARAFLEDAGLADELWKRAAAFVPAQVDGGQATGLHPQFRFYRYETAEQFGVHMDGRMRLGDYAESRLTFMIYLSAVEAGGETKFYRVGGTVQFEVAPTPGKALVFEHQRLHEGAAVKRGKKYVLRTDVMYRFHSPLN
jgi:prolyl 4-hydroxylase